MIAYPVGGNRPRRAPTCPESQALSGSRTRWPSGWHQMENAVLGERLG